MTRYAKRKLKYSLNENFNLLPIRWMGPIRNPNWSTSGMRVTLSYLDMIQQACLMTWLPPYWTFSEKLTFTDRRGKKSELPKYEVCKYIVTVCVFVRHLFSFYPFYFDFHSARIIFDVSSGFYLWNINKTTAWHL
jgi:hypothetical protein